MSLLFYTEDEKKNVGNISCVLIPYKRVYSFTPCSRGVGKYWFETFQSPINGSTLLHIVVEAGHSGEWNVSIPYKRVYSFTRRRRRLTAANRRRVSIPYKRVYSFTRTSLFLNIKTSNVSIPYKRVYSFTLKIILRARCDKCEFQSPINGSTLLHSEEKNT